MTRLAVTCMHIMIMATLTTMAGCLDEPLEDVEDEVSVEESALSFGGAWFYDGGTQCYDGGFPMHCCPPGFVMVGAHVGNNVFRCHQLASGGGARFIDVSTNRNLMHSCPFGAVMVGFHAGANYLLCQYPNQLVTYENPNTYIQDAYPMHVCPGGFAMSGIHVGQNRFNCAY